MKKVLYAIGLALLAVSCTEDYTDWANPFKNGPEAAKSMTMTISPVATIDLATVTTETVQIFTPSITIDDEAETTYQATIHGEAEGDEAEFSVGADGSVQKEILEEAVYALYGQRPVTRNIPMDVVGRVKVGGQTFKAFGSTTLSVIPNAPEIETAYYLTGSINGWNNSDTTYKLTNDGSDPYENPTFTMRIPAPEDGGNVEFKMTPESGLGGDWSKCLAAGSGPAGTFAYNNDGGNLVIEAVEGAKYYDITFNMMELTWSYKAVSFDPFVYFIGATDGWGASDQKLAAVSDGVYTGYLYVADPNGWGLEFKFQLEPGNWDKQLNSNNLIEISGDFEKGGDNIKASAGEGVYFVNLDLNTNVLSAKKITNMNLVGDFNGWNAADDAQQMTWDAENYCYVITGAGVTANGWKFTTNNSWDINLGGNIGDLVANGDNLSVTGTTIKLYPTRKTSDKIYCTVE